MVIKKSLKFEAANHKLRDKKILITAGPTWVPIDSVRVISNIATGETGILLAKNFRKAGAKVTLLLGPQVVCRLDKKIKILHFKFFDEIKELLKKEVQAGKYDAVIHSAAVSDYRPKKTYRHKISSALKRLEIKLVRTEKLIDTIKKIDPQLLLVGFKFLPDVGKAKLINEARKLIKSSRADLIVANTILHNRYKAYIVGRDFTSIPIFTKEDLAENLTKATLRNLM
ncbi:MAG: phosphopantothenoylcysteine decarboxylase [Candidatus Omnitrophica bacterium]|nr:phosphopantothenoylcysteine decarboxylase [Candidatus Omnitrophota bacterium]